MLTDVSIDFGGLEVAELVPEEVPDLYAGFPVQVAGRYRQGGRFSVTVRGRLGSRPVEIPLSLALPTEEAPRPAVRHLWARRRLREIEANVGANPYAPATEALPHALRYGLLSRLTSFVAVEERVRADASDPLRTVGVPVALPAGVSDVAIGAQVLPYPGPDALAGAPVPAGFGYSSGSLSGAGYGRSAGGLTGRSAAVPTIMTGTATVRGSLSREVVRRYVRRHVNRLRFCYERELARDPSLGGTVTLRIVIGPDGTVTAAGVTSSEMSAPELDRCLVEAARRITFPAVPGAGRVVVTYPLVFRPSGAGSR